jgi:hypothetical protein
VLDSNNDLKAVTLVKNKNRTNKVTKQAGQELKKFKPITTEPSIPPHLTTLQNTTLTRKSIPFTNIHSFLCFSFVRLI